jgi:hypothetical protein
MHSRKDSSPESLIDELIASAPLMRKENIIGWKERFPSDPSKTPSHTLPPMQALPIPSSSPLELIAKAEDLLARCSNTQRCR